MVKRTSEPSRRKRDRTAARSQPPQRETVSRFPQRIQRETILKTAAILVLVICAYLPAMRGGFIWDDDAYISQNATMLTLEGLGKNWSGTSVYYQYYPLVLTSFWIEYRLWGLNPMGYHVVNVIVHGLNALLLWAMLWRLGVRWAWFAAAIFALHPVQVESVAWITERKNVFSLFFYLLAGLSYFRFRGVPTDERESARAPTPHAGSAGYYAAALIFFLAALLSKTVTASLPAAILLVLYWKRGRIERRDVVALLPFFALGVAAGLFTAWVERHRIQAEGADWSLTLVERCLVAGRALWFYASKLVVPGHLAFFYPRWHVSQAIWWQYLYPAAALAVILGLWALRRHIGRGPLVATLFFAGTLTPALGFFNVYPMRYSYVADHFQYHACIGLIALAIVILSRANNLAFGRLASARAALGALLLAALAFQTWRQGHIYKNLETLWTDTIAKNPTGWMAHSNLAIVLERQGRLDEALSHSQRALELRPNDPVTKHNVANMLWGHARYDEAEALLQEILAARPDFAPSHYLLSTTLVSRGRLDDAERHLMRGIELDPNYPKADKLMAQLRFAQSRFEESLPYFARALEKDIHNGALWLQAGEAFEALGKNDQAAGAYREALIEQPDLAEAKKRLENLSPTRGVQPAEDRAAPPR